ncbi:MAG: CvpA family protein [Eubacteriales bacterium]
MKNIKNIKKYAILVVIGLLCGFIYYYITLPAINIHSQGFWSFCLTVLGIILVLYILRRMYKDPNVRIEDVNPIYQFKQSFFVKIMVATIGLLVLVFCAGSILSSPLINAQKYQALMTIEEREFTEDIVEVDYSTIPLLDRDSAALLGDRMMGSLVDLVSQFEVSSDYAQINYQGTPVRVTPLEYASPIKWLTNQRDGIPAYILIDMATQDTECVRLEEGILYSKSEYFNRNIYRHLRFAYPTYIFDDQIFFEIDDDGVPYWVCPVKQFNVGLFGGQTVGSVVLCNAITGETIEYAVEEVPEWVDKVYSAELLTQLYDYSGTLKHGYLNSVLSQKDCLITTNGYNYITLNNDVWVYTGVTSVSGDQSNVGFVLMNQRTMETRFYTVAGAIEDSAMESAEGQVQNLQYDATFPLLLNISGEPTYFLALKDAGGLVKMYAMVNVEKYQWVAIGSTVAECESEYGKLLETNGISSQENGESVTISGSITAMSAVVIDGTTHFYLCIGEEMEIYDILITQEELLSIITYDVGDSITITYEEGNGLHTVIAIQ